MEITEETKIFTGVDNAEFEREFLIKDIDKPVRKQILHDQQLRLLVENLVRCDMVGADICKKLLEACKNE